MQNCVSYIYFPLNPNPSSAIDLHAYQPFKIFFFFFFLRIQTRSHNPSRFKKVKLKKSQKEKEKAFYLIPRTQPHYFLKYQIQKHPAIDAYMPHREKCVSGRKKERSNLRCFFIVSKLYFG